MSHEDMLRRALEARAQSVSTSPDALSTIRSRVRQDRRRRRGVTAGLGGLATAAAASITALLLTLNPSGGPVVPPFPSGTASTPAPVTTTPSPSTPSKPPTVAVPIYVAGTDNGKDALYRETHLVVAGSLAERVEAALTNMFSGVTLDPDYHKVWPDGATVRSVQLSGTTISVDLALPATAPADPAFALQQLVYTATAVTADAGESSYTTVKITANGQNRVWGQDTSALQRASHLDVLARIWLSSPQEGAVVGRTFQLDIIGTVPEAGAAMRILDSTGKVVREGPVQLGAGPPTRGEAFVTVTLPPGTYTVEAFFYSLKDSSVQALDDHMITVR